MKFEIVVESPPAGVDYGLQLGKGTDYTTVQLQRSKGKDLHFEFELEWTGSAFRGKALQGPPKERFIYIDIGAAAGQVGTHWSRRLKVPFVGIDATHESWTTRVPGTARDGGPNCATVKPFSGWQKK
ncbi:MAG: hypothetical protein FJW36_23000 [Acidobacteria bacterium]|nr:hypothetical protein [Acidobacteriota bacterium]